MSVSIVIPLYNKAPFIRRALNSILRQSFEDFECIVIDDGSTDRGSEGVREIRDRRIRLVQQVNRGVSAARNRGISEATHPLIAFLDADDEWLPGFLQAAVTLHARHPGLAASFTNMRKGNQPAPLLHPASGVPRLLADYFAFTLSNGGVGMHSSNLMASKEHLTAIGGFPPGRTHGEDLDTWMRLAWSGPVGFVPDVLSIYHEECGASAALGANLDVLPTYRIWLNQGRIPDKLLRSSLALAQLSRYRTIFFYTRAGHTQWARRLYKDLPGPSRLSPHGLASLMSLWNYPAGKYVFYAAEALNRSLGKWRWRARA